MLRRGRGHWTRTATSTADRSARCTASPASPRRPSARPSSRPLAADGVRGVHTVEPLGRRTTSRPRRDHGLAGPGRTDARGVQGLPASRRQQLSTVVGVGRRDGSGTQHRRAVPRHPRLRPAPATSSGDDVPTGPARPTGTQPHGQRRRGGRRTRPTPGAGSVSRAALEADVDGDGSTTRPGRVSEPGHGGRPVRRDRSGHRITVGTAHWEGASTSRRPRLRRSSAGATAAEALDQ